MPKYKTYDELFDEIVSETWRDKIDPEIAIPRILIRKFKELDIKLTDEQLAEIREYVKSGGNGFRIELSDEQDRESNVQPDEEGKYKYTIDLADEVDRLDQLESEIPEVLENLLTQATREWSEEKHQQIVNDLPSILREERKIQQSFQKVLKSTWGEALDKLNVFLSLVTEAGDDIAREYSPTNTDEPDYVYQVLIGLHARACQIGREVHTLLSNGFADGAHARWRSLHEVSVVASFIQEHGQEVAERYLLHDWIESQKAAQLHVKYASRINEPAPSDEELKFLDEEYRSLLARFGKEFASQYGWAAAIIKQRAPNFADI